MWRLAIQESRDGPDVGLGIIVNAEMMVMVPPMVAAILPDPAVVNARRCSMKEIGCLWGVGQSIWSTGRWFR